MLTDEELIKVFQSDEADDGTDESGIRIARAVIAAYEAKLREQKPVAWRKLLCFENGAHEYKFSHLNVLKDGEPLYLHPAPIPEDWTAIHLKTGNEYQVIGEAIDATNTHSNQLMVIYQRDDKTFVREAEEFQEKFMAAARSE